MNRKSIAASITGAVAVVAIVGACSSGPEYTSHLKSDGFPVTQSGTLRGGEGVGFAYGCNSSGGGEVVAQAKTESDARNLAQNDNSIVEGTGASATSDGDLFIFQGTCQDVHAFTQAAGW